MINMQNLLCAQRVIGNKKITINKHNCNPEHYFICAGRHAYHPLQTYGHTLQMQSYITQKTFFLSTTIQAKPLKPMNVFDLALQTPHHWLKFMDYTKRSSYFHDLISP